MPSSPRASSGSLWSRAFARSMSPRAEVSVPSCDRVPAHFDLVARLGLSAGCDDELDCVALIVYAYYDEWTSMIIASEHVLNCDGDWPLDLIGLTHDRRRPCMPSDPDLSRQRRSCALGSSARHGRFRRACAALHGNCKAADCTPLSQSLGLGRFPNVPSLSSRNKREIRSSCVLVLERLDAQVDVHVERVTAH